MNDKAPYVVLLQGQTPQHDSAPIDTTEAFLEQLTCYAYFPNDWLRFARMAFGGPPALMRSARIPRGWRPGDPTWNHGDPETDIQWFYIAKRDAIERGTTFTKLEEKYGELRKLLGETA